MTLPVDPQLALWIRTQALELLKPAPLAMALFGSFARGDHRPESDLDVLIICDEIGRSPSVRSRWFYPLSKTLREQKEFSDLPTSISPLILSSQGWQDAVHLQLSLCTEACVLLDCGLLSSAFAHARVPTRDHGFFWIPKGKTG